MRDDQIVARARLLKQAAHKAAGRRFVLVEGQPGQGKTTFTHQFLKYLDKPYFWYRIEPEDNDPLYLAVGLLNSLKALFPDYDSTLPEEILGVGGPECFEIARILEILFQPARKSSPLDKAIVFDDLHLLDERGLGAALLRGFLELLPRSVPVYCVSRTKIFQDDEALRKSAALFDNNFLSFKNDEAASLFRDVFELSLPGPVVEATVVKTRGWPMGLVMAGSELVQSVDPVDMFDGLQSIEDYFVATVKPFVSEKRWNDLLKLSLLDDFSVPLAHRILQIPESDNFIGKLFERNFFLRRLGDQGEWYEFHHLFLEFLRSRSEFELSQEERHQVLSAAAAWCIENGEFEKALAYSIRHGNLDGTEEMLKIVGLHLYAGNRLVTLHRVLGGMAPEEVANRGILALFSGLSMVGVDPDRAAGLIELSAKRFREDGEAFWELIASSQALFCHMMITFNFHLGRPHLLRLSKLVEELMPVMPPEGQSFVYNAMALGEQYIIGNGEASYQSAIKAISLADRSGLPNVIATALSGGILCCMGTTHLADGRLMMNRARAMIGDQRLSGFQKISLRFLVTHYCAIGGDWVNWRFYRTETENCPESYLLDKGIFRDFFDIEDIDYLLLKGDLLAAEETCLGLMQRARALQKKHILGIALGQYALVSALGGKRAQATEAIDESFEIRKTIGGDTFKAFQYLYAGAAFATLGDVDKTREHLTGVVEMTRWQLGEYSQAIVNLNFALSLIKAGKKEEARENIQEFLDALAKLPLRHLITLHPASIEVICEAVRLDLKPGARMDIVRELFGKSITAAGEAIPAMSARTLGKLTLTWDDRELAMESFTGVQRQLLMHIFCAPGFKLEKDILATKLWPDSDREKAIANFDMTLSRLRKSIDDLLGEKLSRHYLTVKNGVVGLDHCDIDVEQFETAADKGFSLIDANRQWEGTNKLREAESRWQGEFLKGLDLSDEAYQRREQLTARYVNAAQKLATLYFKTQSFQEAEKTARKALLSAPLDSGLNKALHEALVSQGDLPGAKASLETYRDALKKSGFTPQETKELLEEFWKTGGA